MKILQGAIAFVLLIQEKTDPTGEQLIEQLKDESKRPAAFCELMRRAGSRDAKNAKEFREHRQNPELVVCPQGEGKTPIYVLLSDFLPRDASPDVFGGADDALFRQAAPRPRKKDKVIDAFTASGRSIKPFSGNNVLKDGLFADINRTGFVVKVDGEDYSFGGKRSVAVLEISLVREKSERLFAVVYQFGDRDSWSYDFIDEDGDGVPEIQLGPRTLDNEVVPRVTFKWDPAKRTYVGPKGGEGDHFRVIDPTDLWKEFARLEKEKTVFPPEEDRASLRKKGVAEPPQAAEADRPYRYSSLKGHKDEELFAFMGRSGEESRDQNRTGLSMPAGFWSMDAKAAALALVEANRSAKLKKVLQLAIDDRDGAVPGESGTLRFTDESSRCYTASDVHFFLRCDPKGSFLVLANTVEPGVVGRERGQKGRSEAVRVCELEPKDARQILHVVWWLDRVRSKSDELDRFNRSSSTADGRGSMSLTFDGDKKPPTVWAVERLWSDHISDRWNCLYTREVFLNFTRHVLHGVIRQMGEWLSPLKMRVNRDSEEVESSKEALEGQERACSRILALHLADPNLMPPAVVGAAYAVAGELALPSLVPVLEKLKERDGDAKRAGDALQQIGVAKDAKALTEMALGDPKKADWATIQIKMRFPESYAPLLEERLKTARGADAVRLLSELVVADLTKARAFASTVPVAERGALGRAAFAILRDSPETANEPGRVKTQLEIVVDKGAKAQERSEAIDVLVPSKNPLRFPGQDIDQALENILKTPAGQESFDFVPVHAAAALERRRGALYFDATLARLVETKDSFTAQQLLGVTVAMGQTARPEQRARLVDYFKGHLKETNLMVSELCWEIWAADLRELKGDLERIATGGPGGKESDRADTAGGPVQQVQGKFHKARQVAQVWNEEDSLTRAKLEVALALYEAYLFTGDAHHGRRRRLDQCLAAAAKELSGDQRKQVADFATQFASKSNASDAEMLAGIIKENLK